MMIMMTKTRKSNMRIFMARAVFALLHMFFSPEMHKGAGQRSGPSVVCHTALPTAPTALAMVLGPTPLNLWPAHRTYSPGHGFRAYTPKPVAYGLLVFVPDAEAGSADAETGPADAEAGRDI